MNDLNSILLEGNLTRDPELTFPKNGTALCKMAVANNRYYKVNDKYEQEVSYFDIEVWGKTAEACQQYLKQGRGVRISGRNKQNRWKTEEGNSRSKIIIVADTVEFKPEKKTDQSVDQHPMGMSKEQTDLENIEETVNDEAAIEPITEEIMEPQGV